MPRLFILIALVFAFIITICATVKTYACNLPPVAEITSDANDVHVGETTNFDGSDSYDPDGGAIQEYYWVFPDEAYYLSGETTAYPKCKFSPNGDYTVKLKVKDNKEVWSDYYEYEITVLAADPDWYVAKDGDDDEDGQSWQTAFATIQIGIESAVVGDRVWVAQGTYSERINLNGKDITVQSTDPNDWDVAEATIIEADGIGTAVTFTGEESADCLLRGFTITDGGLPDPEDGVVGYWKLDEASGTTAEDSSGNDFDGTYQNSPTLNQDGARSFTGKSVDFNGTDEYADVSYDPNLNPVDFSISVWARVEGNADTYRTPISSSECGNPADPFVTGYTLHVTSGNDWNFFTGVGGAAQGHWDTLGGPAVSLNTWTHIVATFTASSGPDGNGSYTGTKKFYVNGKLEATDSSAGYIPNSSIDLTIGRVSYDYYGYTYPFNGKLDDVRVYDRVLTDAEILRLRARPEGHWRLDDRSDGADPNTAIDSSGNDYDGTLVNGPAWQEYDGYLDGALSFDGTDDYVDVVGYAGVLGKSARTTAAWIKTSTYAYQFIIDWGESDLRTTNYGSGWYMYLDDQGQLHADAWGSGIRANNIDLADGQWHHVAATLENDGTDKTIADVKLYIDGDLVTNTSTVGDYTSAVIDTLTGYNVSLGVHQRIDGSGNPIKICYFDGLIDDVRIYAEELSDGDIQQLYAASCGGGLRGHNTQASISMCRITDNEAVLGAGIYGLSGRVRNCVIADNTAAEYGAAIVGPADVVNCTIVYNTGTDDEAVMDCNSINSSIFWENDPDQIDDGVMPIYSCIEGWTGGGVGNISSDPIFTDAANDDYHLEPNSACIDAGDPNFVYEMEPYGGGGRINMGAYGNTDEATMADWDRDGMPDYWETEYGLDPYDPNDADDDDDDDDLMNLEEFWHGTDPTDDDTDMDGMPDGWEVDYDLDPLDNTDDSEDKDGDGLTNEQEYNLGTDPTDTDSDNDGMPDGWENQYGLNPLFDDSQSDKDSDGMPNLWEYTYGLIPNYDDSGDDLDDDGLTNYQEYQFGSNPNNDDSDDDGMPDGWEYEQEFDPMDPNDADLDLDEDDITNLQEYEYGTDPNAVNGEVSVVAYEHDNAGQVICERIQKIGEIDVAVTEHDFDRLGRSWRTWRWAGTTGASNSNDIISVQKYDVQGNVVEAAAKGVGSTNPDVIDDNKDAITLNEYDSLGRITYVIDPEGSETQYSYYPGGKLEEIAQELVEGESLVATQINFYYTADRLTKVVNGEGHYRITEYNSLDQVICEMAYDCGEDFEEEADDFLLMQTRMEYNGSRISRRAVMADPNATTAEEINEAVDMVTDYDYYGDGEAAPGMLEKQIRYYGGQAETQAITRFGYDGLGRQNWTADAAGNQVFTTYNNMGRVTRRKTIENNQLGDPNLVLTTDYIYDKFGHMVEQRNIADPDEPETYLKTEFEYDCRGLMTKKTSPEGAYTTSVYNAWGLKTEQIADAGGIDQKTEYGYDRLGRQSSITGYADGSTAQTTTYDLDNLGRVETITYPDSKTIQYQYYPQGTVKQRTDQRNLVTNYQYDHMGNLVEKTVTFDGADYEETFAYDGLGRMLEADKYRGATHIATSEFEYNAFSKVTEATETILDASAVEIGYDYDQLANLTGITYPDANSVTIDREALGRIDTISLDGDTIASYKYIGSKVKRRSYNSPSVTYEINYNGLGRATRHYSYTSGGTIADFGYTFDDNGNITAMGYDHRDGDPENDFTYDDLDRLTRVDYLSDQNDNEQFTYDDLGNRTEVDLRDGTTDTYARNELTNRYDDDQGEDIVCEYDLAGNMTKDPNDYEYEYDYENRLIKITKNSGATTVAEFEYDALGRRIEKDDKIAGEVTRYYHNNDWQVLSEKDDNGDTQRWFIYGNFIDEPLVMIDSDEDQHYYAHNHLFSTVALIDESGNVIERYEYNAYGMPTIYNAGFTQAYNSSKYGNPYLFTGRRVDNFDSDSLTLQYNRNRYYDYYTGRWLSHDPLGITPNSQKPIHFKIVNQYSDGLNVYLYCQCSPFIYSDSYGLLRKINIYLNNNFLEHAWLNTTVGELWDFGPDYEWMDENLGHRNYDKCGIGLYCRGEANWGGNSYAKRKGKTKHEQLYLDDDARGRKYQAGKYKGQSCYCFGTVGAVKNCLDAVRKQWDGTQYRHWIRNCITFTQDAMYKCCLASEYDD